MKYFCRYWLLFSLVFPSLCYSFNNHHFTSTTKHTKPFFPKYKHEIYYDTKLIPEDTEITILLHRNHVQKLYFLLEGTYRPISVTVTPCSSHATLEWRISHNVHQNSIVDPYHSASWSNHVLRPPSASPSATYIGNERRSYTNPRAPPGLYNLDLKSDSESSAKILVTTRAISHMPHHPPLPPEPGVQIVKIKRNRVLISWKASLSNRPLEYCVASNNRENYNSLCSAEVDLYGTNSLHAINSAYSPYQIHHDDADTHLIRHGANLSCIGRKTWHLYKGLQKGKTYYFDVFVLDTVTNASSAYVGVSATIRSSGPEMRKMKDDSLETFTLDESNGYTVNTRYQMSRNAGSVLLFVQSCTGPGPVNIHISKSGTPKQEILSTTVMDVKTLEIPRQMAALMNSSTSISLSIRSTTMHSRKVRLWISGKKHAFPFPVLPQDKSVRVFETLTTCNSITIGWKTSPDERVKYCIYRQAAYDELMERTLAEPQNFCEPQLEGSTFRKTVLCRRYHRFSKRRFNNLIMQKIKGLHPGMTYLFEVQVTKVKGKMLPYEQVWATTLDSCSNNKS
ncbi:protein NDNF [Parasteatoda tepidariorum]|uniref:protein NDNF n=1 Tax=Parasteatoda tepidariorum TaxID=114398 RepID=UPI00077FC012|nr:protein NDNF [Parasteatoda tepidariorum]